MKTQLIIIIFCIGFLNVSSASNGVVEINHICATELGCFDGDSLAYPVVINGTAGKSYRLTSDLIIPDENTGGIQIASNDIQIDLNGFSIIRSGCENTTDDCTSASGTGVGIFMNSTLYRGLTVKNGSIIGMGQRGISHIGESGTFENLNISRNREAGLLAGTNSIIRNCIISYNGTGVSAKEGSVISYNTVSYNNSSGISSSLGPSIIKNNAVHNNGLGGSGLGISGSQGSLIQENIVYENNNDGISCFGSQAISNTIYSNGDDGISATTSCYARDNYIRENIGYGIRFASGGDISVISRNVIFNNTAGSIFDVNNFQLFKGFCDTDDVCP